MSYAVKNNKIEEVDDNDVDMEIISPARLFGSHSAIVPLANNAQSSRLFYAGRFANQALALTNREEPLVQSLDPETGKSFESDFGARMGAKYSQYDGTVKRVGKDSITLATSEGDKEVGMYNTFQFNRKSFINNKPVVQAGQQVKKGDILAGSNFTDDKGTMALGLNAYTALTPYKGWSMDDAIVISDSFAKRMSSEHSYEFDRQKDTTTRMGKTHYSSVFPGVFTQEQLDKLDDNGVAKPGTILQKGDPIILATEPKQISSDTTHLGKLSKGLRQLRMDTSEVWEHDYPGTVVDAADGRKTAKAFVTATVPLQEGDKIIAGRNGQKDIIAKIIPDDQMLRDKEGNPFEVILNHLALPSRVNTATLYELAYGKLAKAQGAPISVPSFNGTTSRLTEVKDALAKANIPYAEEVYDPIMAKNLQKPVTTGYSYMYKLHHVVESKNSARANGAYDQDEQPLKGGSDSAKAKRIGGLETTAILAKGGHATMKEASTLRGQKNEEYWRLLRQGYTPPDPGSPFVWDKFKILLNGAGMEARDLGKGTLRLSPLTQREFDKRNPMEVLNGKIVNTATLEPEKGGLFDPVMIAGNRWGKITLPYAVPNPAYEKQIQQLLGITNDGMRKVMAGEMTLAEAQS